jgi:hypothetical protein
VFGEGLVSQQTTYALRRADPGSVRATQLEIAAELPHRSWQAIRLRIIVLWGPGVEIPETGQLDDGETFEDDLLRNPSAAGAMLFLISMNCSRQIRCYRESHRSGGYANPRFNVVALLVHSTPTLGILISTSMFSTNT